MCIRDRMDYCMWLDADDVVTEEEQEKIKRLKEELAERCV